MAALTDFTSYDEVRAALGISDKELEDETLALPMFLDELLEVLHDTHPQLQDVIASIPTDEDAQTPVQKRLLRLYRLLCTYAVAWHVGVSLPMVAPRSLGDGKATMSRFQEALTETLARLETWFNQNKAKVQELVDEILEEPTVETAPRVFFGVGLATDPVTE